MKLTIPSVRAALAARVALEREAERRAAVATILREKDTSMEVLLIRRATKLDDPWSGHMAFPGGRQAADDDTLYVTAIRETCEEVGLDLQQGAELLGCLDDVTAIARGKRLPMLIRPFVFALRDTPDPVLRPQVEEVADALWVPLLPLMQGQRDAWVRYEGAGQKLELPGFQVESHVVWGLTHGMLSALFALLRDHERASR